MADTDPTPPRYRAVVALRCSGVRYEPGEPVDTDRLTSAQVQTLLTWKRIALARIALAADPEPVMAEPSRGADR